MLALVVFGRAIMQARGVAKWHTTDELAFARNADDTASDDTELPDYVVRAGPALAIPYNGSVSRVNFSPKGYLRLRRWVAENGFDVLHVHEPNSPSISMLSLMVASGPIVTTFHTATSKSLWLSVFQGILRPYHERIAGKIAVSELARRWQMESLGSDAVEIPNGINVAGFADDPQHLRTPAQPSTHRWPLR